MSETYAVYDASKPIGGELARAVDQLRQGLDTFRRAKSAIDTATDAGNNKDALIGGDFGAADSANASKVWDACYTIGFVMDNADLGGLKNALAALDKGISG